MTFELIPPKIESVITIDTINSKIQIDNTKTNDTNPELFNMKTYIKILIPETETGLEGTQLLRFELSPPID